MYRKNEQGYAPVLSRPGHLGCNGIEEEQDSKNQIASPVHPIPFCSFLCLPSPCPFPLVAHLHGRSHSLTHTTPSSRVRPREDRDTEKEKRRGRRAGNRAVSLSTYNKNNTVQSASDAKTKTNKAPLSNNFCLFVCLPVSNGVSPLSIVFASFPHVFPLLALPLIAHAACLL